MSRPQWEVNNEGSFASVLVKLPPGHGFYCETDAVVTMSRGIDVNGTLPGGILGALARMFLTNESFFSTRVENASSYIPGDVLIAPSEPGGIALHRLAHGEDLLLTSGAYLAADDGVTMTSVTQRGRLGNSLMSGTGLFLLRASGHGNVAINSFGSILKYSLGPGQTRMVDNGHLVAWTGSMKYTMKLASRKAGIFGSLTSGEGLHCEFEGPGFLYIQSHKPNRRNNDDQRGGARGDGGGGTAPGYFIVAVFAIVLIVSIVLGVLILLQDQLDQFSSFSAGGRQQNDAQYGSRQRLKINDL